MVHKDRPIKQRFDIQCAVYHIVVEIWGRAFNKALQSAEHQNKLEGYKLNIPWIRLIITLAVFYIFYRIGVPASATTNGHLDYTIWTSLISIEVAIAIGLIALAPWFAETLYTVFFGFLIETAQMKLMPFTVPDPIPDEKLSGVIEDEITKRKREVRNLDFNIMRSGVSLLIVPLIVLPSVFWMSTNVQVGILIATLAWFFTGFEFLITLWIFSNSKLFFITFRSLKEHHDTQKDRCKVCASHTSSAD